MKHVFLELFCLRELFAPNVSLLLSSYFLPRLFWPIISEFLQAPQICSFVVLFGVWANSFVLRVAVVHQQTIVQALSKRCPSSVQAPAKSSKRAKWVKKTPVITGVVDKPTDPELPLYKFKRVQKAKTLFSEARLGLLRSQQPYLEFYLLPWP